MPETQQHSFHGYKLKEAVIGVIILGVRSRTNLYKYSFLRTVIREWNSIPNSIRETRSLPVFKSKVF